MKTASFCLVLWLYLMAAPGFAADGGTFTIVEGSSRVLRDTKWYKLVAGARFQEGDIIDAAEKAQVQVELTKGGILNLVGPATLFAAALPMRNDQLTGALEFALPRGWLKLSAKTTDTGVRLRSSVAVLNLQDGVVVMHNEPNSMETFVESGAMKITESGTGGKDGATHDAKAGEYWARAADRPLSTERRAPPPFVAAMPRHLIDPLPSIAARYKDVRVQLVLDRDITYAEAAPWLNGPYRKSFLKRFGPRLQDREFRGAVEANIAHYPEWDRVLHPEKYLPKSPAPAT
jgi:hypothetical protein